MSDDPHADMLARAEADRMRDANELEEVAILAAYVAYGRAYHDEGTSAGDAMRAAIESYIEIAPRWQMAYRAGAKKMREKIITFLQDNGSDFLNDLDETSRRIGAIPLPGKAPSAEPKDYDHA